MNNDTDDVRVVIVRIPDEPIEGWYCTHCGQPLSVPGGAFGGGEWEGVMHKHPGDHTYPALPPPPNVWEER
jgi:hypothetical protein